MSIYKVRPFSRWARKHGLTDSTLRQAVREIREGLYEADQSVGFRTVVASRDGDRCFFLFGFAKNERGNIDEDEEAALKRWASTLVSMQAAALARAEAAGELVKVDDDA